MRAFVLALTLFIAAPFAAASTSQANQPTEADIELARGFVTELADEAIMVLTTSESRDAREAGFRKILDERANMRRIARFTLGQFVRKISKEDFATFQGLLNDLIVKVYANRLGEYSNEKVMVGKGQAKKRNFVIASRIEFANGREPITIDWWLVREKDGSFSLFDVRVLGVWMAQEQRDSFASVLKNNKGDMNALLDHLRKQVETGAE